MAQDDTYNAFLREVYKQIIDVKRMQNWLKINHNNSDGVLCRVDDLFGVKFDYHTRNENLSEDGSFKRNGILTIVRKIANKTDYKECEKVKDFVKNFEEQCCFIKKTLILFLIGDFKEADKNFAECYKLIGNESFIYFNGQYSYRMRKRLEGEAPFTELDLYHVPFTSRSKIKSYRYSIPGYPCLYLSKSLYSCWEEMRRPHLDEFYYSCYRSRNDIKLLDLRIQRGIKDEEIEKMESYLKTLPLILTCTMQVKEDGGSFIPEYIMPQHVFKTVLKEYRASYLKHRGNEEKIKALCRMGIAYSSAMEDVWFEFSNNPNGYELIDNYAVLPILQDKQVGEGAKYCKVLANIFKITTPHCYEYEYIKNSAAFFNKAVKIEQDTTNTLKNYEKSYLYYLEEVIKKEKMVKIAEIIHKENDKKYKEKNR